MPSDTFRNAKDPASSSLYDIGCYVLALLADLGIDLTSLDIVSAEAAGTMSESVDLAGTLDGVSVTAQIGVGAEYQNSVTVTLADDFRVKCQPIFYGRPGTRILGNETIEESDSFQAMFAVPRERWLADQAQRLAAIVSLTEKLELLAMQLIAFRANAG
jgi:hypothetical protein